MSQTYIRYPTLTGGSSGIPIYPTFSAFPASAPNGTAAVAADTSIIYVYSTTAVAWLVDGGPGVALTIGTIDGQPAVSNGLQIVTNALYAQSASASEPGLINNTTQSFSGNKSFTGSISASNLSGTNTGDVTIGTANGLSLIAQVLSLGLSSTSTTGALSSTDWNTFNNKQSALTLGNLTDAGTDGITITGGTGAVVGSGTSISQHVADTTHNGYLSSTDWNTFNSSASTGANNTLSNLASPTAFNQTLLPHNTNSFDIGAAGTVLRSLFVNTIKDNTGQVCIQVLNHDLVNAAGNIVLNFNGANLDVNTRNIINLVDPVNPQDAATKNYVDTHTGTGTVTSVSVVSANGLAGTVATATTTPAITLSTTITGILQGNGTAISAATTGNLTDVGTDGIVITNGTGVVLGSGTSIAQHVADTTHNGYLSSTDWNTFNTSAGSAITSLTGDATATGPGAAALTLATVNSNVGTFGSSTSIPTITVNAKGLVTAASGNAIVAPAGTLSGTTLASNVVTSSLTSLGIQNVALNMGTHLINNVVNPVSAQDAATKAYVDNTAAGINPAVAVQAATTSASDTSGFTYNNGVGGIGATFTGSVNTPVVIDGFTFTALGQRLLVKNDTQSPSGAFNGIYYVTQVQTALLAPILTRALDYDQPSDINNTGVIPVINGTVNGTTQWVETSLVNTVGTDPLVFTKFARNPADYLLKANNLSDVASANTSFNNISPMTTVGDMIYEDATPKAVRLPIGTNGQIMTVSSGIPAWTSISASGQEFYISSAVTTMSSTITASTFTTFSNSPAFTFTPILSGTYKVYCSIPELVNTNLSQSRVFNTSGGATLLAESQANFYGSAVDNNQFVQSVYTLTSGTAYVFDIQGQVDSTGNLSNRGDRAPFYMFAERMGN